MSNKWTTKNIPDLTQKIAVVTGANNGLGFETTKALLSKNATVIMACRNLDKAKKALTDIREKTKQGNADIIRLDLADLSSVQAFSNDFHKKYDQLNILVNNAGIMAVPYALTKDGYEIQFGTNHLGHFALTGLLLDILKKTDDSRVVNVSSFGHKTGIINFDNLMYDGGEGYDPQAAYSQAKLSNLLFTYELQRFFEKNDINSKALASHPGISKTNLLDHFFERRAFRISFFFLQVFIQNSAMGALPSLRAATDPQAKGGEYYGPGGFKELRGHPIIVQPADFAKSEKDAKQLWEISERLTNVKFE